MTKADTIRGLASFQIFKDQPSSENRKAVVLEAAQMGVHVYGNEVDQAARCKPGQGGRPPKAGTKNGIHMVEVPDSSTPERAHELLRSLDKSAKYYVLLRRPACFMAMAMWRSRFSAEPCYTCVSVNELYAAWRKEQANVAKPE